MTHADRAQRQLEDNKSDLREGAVFEALHRPTGKRAKFTAVKIGDKLLARSFDRKLVAKLDDLVLLSVTRRGFEGGK